MNRAVSVIAWSTFFSLIGSGINFIDSGRAIAGEIVPISFPIFQPTFPRAPVPTPNTAPARNSLNYQHPDGLFQITLPSGYTYDPTGSGIAFVSADQRFGGSVDYGSAQGEDFNLDELERSLKQVYEQRLSGLVWQGSTPQSDGSLRVDWTGYDTQGNQLDAISFVEQRGDTIFILNLFGINAPYNNEDAAFIVQDYRVQR